MMKGMNEKKKMDFLSNQYKICIASFPGRRLHFSLFEDTQTKKGSTKGRNAYVVVGARSNGQRL